jgi:hypothetical protein
LELKGVLELQGVMTEMEEGWKGVLVLKTSN